MGINITNAESGRRFLVIPHRLTMHNFTRVTKIHLLTVRRRRDETSFATVLRGQRVRGKRQEHHVPTAIKIRTTKVVTSQDFMMNMVIHCGLQHVLQ